MNTINNLVVWVWLLSISLLIPITLPARGLRKPIIEEREDITSSPIIALNEFNLLSTITEEPLVIAKIQAGTPVDVLKEWNTPDSGKWLLVNVLTQSSSHFFYKRGWVRIGFT